MNTTTVLNLDYVAPQRPYSGDELLYLRKQYYKMFHLGEVYALHEECGHVYLTKKNGKKETMIKHHDISLSEDSSIGNCSVCWKMSRTPKKFADPAYDLVKYYHENIYPNLNQNPTYDEVMAEKDYYTWLYNEFNMRDRHKKHVVSNQTTDETDSTD